MPVEHLKTDWAYMVMAWILFLPLRWVAIVSSSWIPYACGIPRYLYLSKQSFRYLRWPLKDFFFFFPRHVQQFSFTTGNTGTQFFFFQRTQVFMYTALVWCCLFLNHSNCHLQNWCLESDLLKCSNIPIFDRIYFKPSHIAITYSGILLYFVDWNIDSHSGYGCSLTTFLPWTPTALVARAEITNSELDWTPT